MPDRTIRKDEPEFRIELAMSFQGLLKRSFCRGLIVRVEPLTPGFIGSRKVLQLIVVQRKHLSIPDEPILLNLVLPDAGPGRFRGESEPMIDHLQFQRRLCSLGNVLDDSCHANGLLQGIAYDLPSAVNGPLFSAWTEDSAFNVIWQIVCHSRLDGLNDWGAVIGMEGFSKGVKCGGDGLGRVSEDAILFVRPGLSPCDHIPVPTADMGEGLCVG